MNELLCTSCVHNGVCKYRDRYAEVQEVANRMHFTAEGGSIIYLSSLKWIEPIRIQCKNYIRGKGESIR